jgi:hypothetical protein
MEGDVEHGPTILARPSSSEPAHQFLRIHFNVYHVVDELPDFGKNRLESLGLGDRSRKSIENKTLPAVGSLESLLNDPDDQLIRDELSSIHKRLRLHPQGSLFLHRRSQDIASRNLGNMKPFNNL